MLLLNAFVCKCTLLISEVVPPLTTTFSKGQRFLRGVNTITITASCCCAGAEEAGHGGEVGVGRRMRETASADRGRGNSDMTMTNCLVFIQIV